MLRKIFYLNLIELSLSSLHAIHSGIAFNALKCCLHSQLTQFGDRTKRKYINIEENGLVKAWNSYWYLWSDEEFALMFQLLDKGKSDVKICQNTSLELTFIFSGCWTRDVYISFSTQCSTHCESALHAAMSTSKHWNEIQLTSNHLQRYILRCVNSPA